MSERSRKTVGVYDRPHPLRTRKALMAALIAIVIAAAYALFAYLM